MIIKNQRTAELGWQTESSITFFIALKPEIKSIIIPKPS